MAEQSMNFKCKTCGALLDELVQKSQNGLVECPYCLNVWTIPKKETSPAALSSLRMGEHDLDTGKFDDAYTAYKKAAELDPKEPEAYFGMALAAFKVQYLRVAPTRKGEKPRLQPICHEVKSAKFAENANYKQALLLATPKQREEYERKAKEIDYILAEFCKLKQSGADYDCFLCVKVSGENGKTEDSKDADYIYDLLKNKGYKPFYSERELRNVTGADYEARILYALVRAECMLVICRNEEYLQTPWVKNEYTRFLKLVNDEEKESDSITLVFYEKPIERLPGRNGKLQGIDFSRREADGKIVDFVENHTPAARARRAEAEKQKNLTGEDLLAMMRGAQEAEERKKDAEAKRFVEEQEKARRAEELRLREEARRKEIAESENKKRELDMARRMFAANCKIRKGVLKWATKGIAEVVIVPDGVTEIAEEVFADDNKIKEVILPEGLVTIGEHAFKNCTFLTKVVLPDSLRTIGKGAFSECRNLKSVTIPNGVTSIGASAFGACPIEQVIIPKSVTSIGGNAFRGEEHLVSYYDEFSFVEVHIIKKIEVEDGNAVYRSENNCLIERSTNTLILGCANSTIPQGVTAIGNDAFQGCPERCIIPEGVVSIGDSAFRGQKISELIFPSSLKSIGNYAFCCCNFSNHPSLVIPEGVTTIGSGAFGGCDRLSNVVIPISVTKIDKHAFSGHGSALGNVVMPKKLAGFLGSNLSYIFGSTENIKFAFIK